MSTTQQQSAGAAPKSKSGKKKKSGTGAKPAAAAGAGAATAAPAATAATAETKVAATSAGGMTIAEIDEKTKNLVKSDSSSQQAAVGFLELKEETKVTVPNVASKLSEKEQARLQAQIGNLQKVGAIFVTNEAKETKKFETKEKVTDLKQVPTVYIKGCTDCHYTIAQRSTKILIDGCKNSTITIEGDVLTRTVEMWKCENVQLKVKTSVKTLQLDLSEAVGLHFEKTDHLGALVWAHVEDAHLTFADGKEHDIKTGFKHMLKEHPDSVKDVDQFIVRFLEGKLTSERCVRLKNGFLSTEREAIEWEKRNEIKKNAYVEEFLKSAGVHLNKSKGGKKVQPNEPCPCGSTKKYKRCCQGKTALTGVEGDEIKATV